MTAREVETRRRRRERREALEQAEREYAVGGPLIDAFAPVIGGGDLTHPGRVALALAERQDRIATETLLLGAYFAGRCLVRAAVRLAMLQTLVGWQERYGKPGVIVQESTHSTTGTGTIPAL